MTEMRYCILCGEPFETDDPGAVFCPAHGGKAPAKPGGECGEEVRPPVGYKRKAESTTSGMIADWKPGDLILDTYEIKGKLGEGGFGAVYRAHHKGWNMDLAVKRALDLDEENKQGFIDEAQKWIDLGLHPHIISCYYVRNINGFPHTFAELAEGGSLESWIRGENYDLYEGGQKQALQRILDIAIQFAWGLGYAHQQGLVHQDVKPQNVLMTPDGVLKVTDFGLAKAKRKTGETPESGIGADILVSGGGYTLAYRSPEQAQRKKLSQKTDMWSWAVSVLEMFDGGISWKAGDLAGYALESYLGRAGEEEDIPPMPGVVAELLRECFQEDPQSRPKDMYEIAERLVTIYPQETGKAYTREIPKPVDLRADSLNNKALSLLDLGKEDEAEKAWQQAIKTHPNHIHATFNLNRWLWKTGKQPFDTDLIKNLESLVANNPGDTTAISMLAEIQLERGHFQESIAVFEKLETVSSQLPDQIKRTIQTAHNLASEFRNNHQRWKSLKDHIYSVDISADSSLGISAGSDITNTLFEIKIWDLKEEKQIGTLSGHTKRITSVALSPDGRFALSGSEDLSIRLWDIQAHNCIQILTGHENTVNSVAISDNVKYAVSGSDDGTIRMWNLDTGQCVYILQGHGRPVKCVALSVDGSRAISGGKDQTAQVWDLDWQNGKGRCVQVLEGHSHDVYSVAITPDGNLGFSGSGYDHTLCAWDLNKRKLLWQRNAHEYEVFALAVTMAGEFVISSSSGEIRVWETKTGTCARTLQEAGTSYGIAVVPDGSMVFTGDRYGFLSVWRPCLRQYSPSWSYATPRTMSTALKTEESFQKHLEEILGLVELRDFKNAADKVNETRNISGFERHPKLLELASQIGKHGQRKTLLGAWELRQLTGHDRMVMSVDISPDGKFALSAGTDMILRYWDLETGQCISEMKGHRGYLNHINSAVFSPNGKNAATGCGDLSVRLWNLAEGNCIHTLTGHKGGVQSVAFSPDGSLIASVSANKEGVLRLWDVTTGECIKILVCQADVLHEVNLSPQGLYALVAADRSLQYWDLARGEQVFNQKAQPKCARISPDGRFAFTGSGISDQYSIRVWDLDTQSCIRKLVGHKEEIYSLVITADSRFLCSGSRDRTIRFWDIDSGECVWVLDQFANIVTSVKFSRDGRYLLCGCWDSTVHQWQLDWEYEFPQETPWNDGALAYLEAFLYLHRVVAPDKISRQGKSVWDEKAFSHLMDNLGFYGYGWLREEGVRNKLEEMAKERG